MIVATLLLSAVLTTNPDVYAVVIGHNGGTAELQNLEHADDDALRIARFFTAVAPADQIVALTRPDESTRKAIREGEWSPTFSIQPPTRRAIHDAFETLRARLAARTATTPVYVYFTYAGHGLPGRFLVEPEQGREAAITGSELKALLGSLPATQLVVLIDACRSQSLFVERGESSDFSREIAELDRRTRTAKIGVLTAAGLTSPAAESSALRAGYFSHVLTSGLSGAADANDDQIISFAELSAFIAFNTQRYTRHAPWFEPPGGNLHAALIDLRFVRSRLTLGAPLSGRFLVRTRDGVFTVAEVFKASGKRLQLIQPPGRYSIVRRDERLDVEIERNTAVELDDASFAAARSLERDRGEHVAALGFDAPFSSSVVDALGVGYSAGRPPAADGPSSNAVRVGYTLSPAPFSLSSLEHGVSVAYEHRFRALSLGVRADYRFSDHFVGASEFGLRRVGVTAEGAARFTLVSDLMLVPHLGGGARWLWRTQSGGATSGDFGPILDGGARIELRVARPFSVIADGWLELSFPRVSGAHYVEATPLATLGVAFEWK